MVSSSSTRSADSQSRPMGLSLEIFCQDGNLDRGCGFRASAMTPERIDVAAIEQAVVEHLGEPPETLGPDKGHIFIRQSLLAAGIGLLGLDAGSGNIVKLRQQTDPVVLLLEREKRRR